MTPDSQNKGARRNGPLPDNGLINTFLRQEIRTQQQRNCRKLFSSTGSDPTLYSEQELTT
jgi:hypothetical protein